MFAGCPLRQRRRRQPWHLRQAPLPSRGGNHVPTAEPTTPLTHCSGRTAATTSRPEPCRARWPTRHLRPHRRPPNRRHHKLPSRRRLTAITPVRCQPSTGWPRSGLIRRGTRHSKARIRCLLRPPGGIPLREKSILVGRISHSRNIHPQIDCEPDSGVSRRQTQLTTDGSRWWVEDLDSANGTFVAAATDPIPSSPIPVGSKQELAADDRIYVGAWTRIVIRRATDDERASLG